MVKNILTSTPDKTTPDAAALNISEQATDAAAVTPRTPVMWIHRKFLKAGLSPTTLLIEAAVTDRADNKTGLLKWDNDAIAKRCGPGGKPLSRKTVSGAQPILVKAGFISIEREARGSKPALVRVHKVPSKQRLEVPLALLWAGAGEPLKATSTNQAAAALTALLALLSIADFVTRQADVNQVVLAAFFTGRVETKKGGTRLGRQSMGRAICELELLAGPAMTIDKKQLDHGRYQKNSYSLDWSLLPDYERMPADSPEVHSDFPGGEFMTGAALEQASIIPVAILELVAAFHEKIMERRRKHLSPDAPIVQINPSWFANMSTVVADGALVADVDEVIRFAFQNEFWRSNIHTPTDLAKHYLLMRGDADFVIWREAEGLIEWPDEVHAICDSMVNLLNYIYPPEKHTVDPAWRRGASRMLTKYSVVEIEDMFEWAITSARHISNVGSLLKHEWVATKIRRDNEFILWSKQKNRPWALRTHAFAPKVATTPNGRTPNGRAPARRIGAKVAGDEVFRRLAAAQDTPEAKAAAEAHAAAFRKANPKVGDEPAPPPEKSLITFPECNRL